MPPTTQILLALNDPQALQSFQRAVHAANYQASVAQDLRALEKSLMETSPSLLVLGEVFGGKNGLEVAVQQLARFPTLPILLFLDHDSHERVKQALHLGISDCLCPPLTVGSIKQTIENSLARARRIGDWNRRQVKLTTASLKRRVDELKKLQTVLTTIEDGVIILDQANCILLMNPIVRRAFGLVLQDYAGEPVLDVISHPDFHTLLNSVEINALPFHDITFEDGRIYNAQFTPIPGIGSAITMQDISYLKQIDRLKSEFVHAVSHDVRSPLTAILGYLEILQRTGTLNDQQQDCVHRIQASVQSITSLVNELLDLGKIEAGRDTRREIIPLDGLIRYTLDNLNNQIKGKHLALHVDIPKPSPAWHGNQIRLRQMMDNLVGNAIKYTPEGGRIMISVETQDNQVILRITDTGLGIPPADQQHIFEKFYRATNVPDGVGGSGLGLAIVKSIVESHQGRVWVESTLGEGTTFTIVLPKFERNTPSKAT